jgi:hypothetical protein
MGVAHRTAILLWVFANHRSGCSDLPAITVSQFEDIDGENDGRRSSILGDVTVVLPWPWMPCDGRETTRERPSPSWLGLLERIAPVEPCVAISAHTQL